MLLSSRNDSQLKVLLWTSKLIQLSPAPKLPESPHGPTDSSSVTATTCCRPSPPPSHYGTGLLCCVSSRYTIQDLALLSQPPSQQSGCYFLAKTVYSSSNMTTDITSVICISTSVICVLSVLQLFVCYQFAIIITLCTVYNVSTLLPLFENNLDHLRINELYVLCTEKLSPGNKI